MMCLFFIAIFLFFIACSNEYTPENQTSGEQIFLNACLQCHPPAKNGNFFSLNPKNANNDYISNKIKFGSLFMPAFSKLSPQDLTKISRFVLEYNDSFVK